jgi:HK97 family phage major capsid protein
MEKLEMSEIQKAVAEGVASGQKAINDMVQKQVAETVGKEVAERVRATVDELGLQRKLYGHDRTGLSKTRKQEIAGVFKSLKSKTKAGALLEEQDSAGGFLVAADVASAILRVAASVGIVMNKAMKWSMNSDELDIPAYTGAFLTGGYIGTDTAGVITGLAFNQARLLAKKWQIAFAVGNDLLNDASVELADWLIAFSGEALANMIDRQGLTGGSLAGDPFVGILNNPDVQKYSLPAAETAFADYQVVDDSAQVIAQVEESILDDFSFLMHRSVWGSLRSQKDAAGNYLLPWAGAATILTIDPDSLGGPKPVGTILGYPVFTSRHMPSLAATAADTKFIIAGNLGAGLAYGERTALSLDEFKSGAFGGKEIALADQTAFVLRNRHAVTVQLPTALVNVATHS